jgi:two-component system, cell cycle sensor histidine kinase and response regulator CckA
MFRMMMRATKLRTGFAVQCLQGGNTMQQKYIPAIRQRAEEYLKNAEEEKTNPSFVFKDSDEIIQELNVYRVELEMQNEEHKREQEMLNNAKEKYSSLFDFAPIGYFTLNEDSVITEANVTGAHTLEIERDALIGLPFTKFIERNSQDQFYLTHRRAYTTLKTQSCELRLRTSHGNEFDAQLHCLVFETPIDHKPFLRCAISDISKLKQTEIELRVSEEKFRTFIEEAFEGFVLLDEFGSVIEWNKANEQITGLKRREVIGRPVWEIQFRMVLPEHRTSELLDHLRATIQEALRTGDSPVFNRTLEVPFHRADGTKGYMLQTAFPIRLQTGFRIGAVYRDITERKHSEELMRHTQRMESLGLLAGGIAHDFNNLLQAVLGQTTLALKALPSSHPVRENIEKATKATERAAQLTQQLLAYSGRGKFEIRSLNLNTFLQDNMHMLQVSLGKNVILQSQFGNPLPTIEVDPGQLQQIVMNLIINANEAIGDQAGLITVTTSLQSIVEADRRWRQRTGETLAVGNYVVLEVSDTGCGMTRETVEKIFDPFFTTKFTGRGLGLAAVIGIVKGHKGGLEVESTLGEGTTFRVAFPAGLSEAIQEKPAEVADEELQLEGTILIVDDEDFVREAAKNILELNGLTILTAANGGTALEMFRGLQDAVDVVLLDLSMPGISGEETFRRLKEICPNVQVILTSGYSESEATAKLTGQDLAGFIQKPYRAEDLTAIVHKHIQKRKLGSGD